MATLVPRPAQSAPSLKDTGIRELRIVRHVGSSIAIENASDESRGHIDDTDDRINELLPQHAPTRAPSRALSSAGEPTVISRSRARAPRESPRVHCALPRVAASAATSITKRDSRNDGDGEGQHENYIAVWQWTLLEMLESS